MNRRNWKMIKCAQITGCDVLKLPVGVCFFYREVCSNYPGVRYLIGLILIGINRVYRLASIDSTYFFNP